MAKEAILPAMVELARFAHNKNNTDTPFNEKRVIRITHAEKNVILLFYPRSFSIFNILKECFEETKDLSFNERTYSKISFILNGVIFSEMDDHDAITIAYSLMAMGIANKFSSEERKRQPNPKDKIA